MKDKNLIQMKNITKSFPGVIALDKVNLTIKASEVHALVGENGAVDGVMGATVVRWSGDRPIRTKRSQPSARRKQRDRLQRSGL